MQEKVFFFNYHVGLYFSSLLSVILRLFEENAMQYNMLAVLILPEALFSDVSMVCHDPQTGV